MEASELEVLKKLVTRWRAKAAGHYCQTYNRGMAEGLESAANELEQTFPLEEESPDPENKDQLSLFEDPNA